MTTDMPERIWVDTQQRKAYWLTEQENCVEYVRLDLTQREPVAGDLQEAIREGETSVAVALSVNADSAVISHGSLQTLIQAAKQAKGVEEELRKNLSFAIDGLKYARDNFFPKNGDDWIRPTQWVNARISRLEQALRIAADKETSDEK